jgi:hypothetical protein
MLVYCRCQPNDEISLKKAYSTSFFIQPLIAHLASKFAKSNIYDLIPTCTRLKMGINRKKLMLPSIVQKGFDDFSIKGKSKANNVLVNFYNSQPVMPFLSLYVCGQRFVVYYVPFENVLDKSTWNVSTKSLNFCSPQTSHNQRFESETLLVHILTIPTVFPNHLNYT